jgi:ATP-dependent helicase HrpB
MATSLISLPIDEFLPEAGRLLQAHQNLVVVAAPGAGKTTRLPAFLATQFSGKVLVLEPRRMAAIAAAHRVAEEQGFTVGDEVGYQVRFANKTSARTRLMFLTEALLAKKLTQDPELAGVDCIVLDEFHERSLHVDLALGLLRELQLLGHPIRLVVMSATLDAAKISRYLGTEEAAAPILDVPGKLFPLEIQYQKSSQMMQTSPKFIEVVAAQIKEAERATAHDILVFLPGVGEIERTLQFLEPWASERQLDLVPLHGSLPLEAQRRALQSGPRRRVILSTNIAESSVTVDGVACVIDCGLARSQKFDLRTGFSRLELGRISRSSAQQRAGRAARQFPGVCYRLWNKLDETSMPAQDIPEILRSELSESLLFLASQGVRQFDQFSWYEAPSILMLTSAERGLRALGALDESNVLTSLGTEILRWPLPPRLAKLMLVAIEKNAGALGADIAAILQERDFMQKQSSALYLGDQLENDLRLRLEVLEQFRQRSNPRGMHRLNLQTVEQAARQLLSLVPPHAQTSPTAREDVRVLLNEILFASYADRLCRRRSAGSDKARMVGGRGVKLSPESIVQNSEFFLALDGVEGPQNSETQVSLAAGLEKAFVFKNLGAKIEKQQMLDFDKDSGQFYLRESRVWNDLVLEEGGVRIAAAAEVTEHLPQVLTAEWEWVLKENPALHHWVERFAFLIRKRDLVRAPSVRSALANFTGLEDLEGLRLDAFTMAATGEKDFFVVARKNLLPFFEMLIAKPVVDYLAEHVPPRLQVPSGNHLLLHYPADREPYMEVRIQEVFGWHETPKLLEGQQPLTLHLLAPNYRPMQITSNLQSFWDTAYNEVRKELRLRYPKHSWPEDPWTAVAVSKGRPTKG